MVPTPIARPILAIRSRWSRLLLGLLVGWSAGCNSPAPESGEDSLGPIEQWIDPLARSVWPGLVASDGVRRIPLRSAFFEGEAVRHWYGGAATRDTADVFWFCDRDDPSCPFDDRGVLQPETAHGDPIFARIPGEGGYSPYWLVWVVRVGQSYVPGSLKSVEGIEQAEAAGEVTVEQHLFDHGGEVGPDGTVMNCLLVLAGTELEGNGVQAAAVPARRGWHKRYFLNYFDFTESEGVIPPDAASESLPQMPASDMYVLHRDCAGGSSSPICAQTEAALAPVNEPALGFDLNGDGDTADSNNLLASYPGRTDEGDPDRPYTALWRMLSVRVRPEYDDQVLLLDGPEGNQLSGLAQMRELIELGWLDEPEVMVPPEGGITTTEELFDGPVQITL